MSGIENKIVTSSWTYSERDVILYALSVGCTSEETAYVYECHAKFGVLPTFGVLPLYNGGLKSVDLSSLVPNYNPVILTLILVGPSSGPLKDWHSNKFLSSADAGFARRAVLGAAAPLSLIWHSHDRVEDC